jgi:hypothetical protein
VSNVFVEPRIVPGSPGLPPQPYSSLILLADAPWFMYIPPIIPRCAPQALRIDPEMASPLRKLNCVRRASDMGMWAVSSPVVLFLVLSTSHDGGDELGMMEMLKCTAEFKLLDVDT